jgi:hypothetical protein
VYQECGALEVQHGDAVPATAREPQPWHAADEAKPASRPSGGGSIGTHSLTGGALDVGVPGRRTPEPAAEHGAADAPPERSGVTDLLGKRPDANRER